MSVASAQPPGPAADSLPGLTGGLAVSWGELDLADVLAAAHRHELHRLGIDVPGWRDVEAGGVQAGAGTGVPEWTEGCPPGDTEHGGAAEQGELLSAAALGGHMMIAPGPVLAGWLACARPRELDDAALVTSITNWRRLTSWAQAQELAAVAELAHRRGVPAGDADHADLAGDAAEDDAQRAGQIRELEAELVPQEVALALTLTRTGAEYWMELAVSLAGRLPRTLAALSRGEIDLSRARLIDQYTAFLPDDLAQRVETRVLAKAERQTAGQLRAALQRAVIAADPDAAERRRQEAEKNARVELAGDHDGTASLGGRFLPAAQAAAAWARICALAKAMESAGAVGGADLLRAQVFTGLLLGTLPLIPPAQDLLDETQTAASHCEPPSRGGGNPHIGHDGESVPGERAEPAGGETGRRRRSSAGNADTGSRDRVGRNDDAKQDDSAGGGEPGEGGGSGGRGGEPGVGRESADSGGDPGDGGELGDSAGELRDGGESVDGVGKPGNGGEPGHRGGEPGGNGQPGGGGAGQRGSWPSDWEPGPAGTGLSAGYPSPPEWPPIPPPGHIPSPGCARESSAGLLASERACGPGGPSPGNPAWVVGPPGSGRREEDAGAGRGTRASGYYGKAVLSVPWRTLAGLTGEPGELSRIGPVTAGVARTLAAAAAAEEACEWRLIVTSLAGEVLTVTSVPRTWRVRRGGEGPAPSPPVAGSRAALMSQSDGAVVLPGPGLIARVTLTIPVSSPDRPGGTDGPAEIDGSAEIGGQGEIGTSRCGGVSVIRRDGVGLIPGGPPDASGEIPVSSQGRPGLADPAGWDCLPVLRPVLAAALRAATRAAARCSAAGTGAVNTDECTHGDAVSGYRVPGALRALIEARDQTCRFPGCRQPAWRCDQDHTVAYQRGGPTCPCNLGAACRRHHRLKQHPDWLLTQPRPGVLTWRTPAGLSYPVTPETHPV